MKNKLFALFTVIFLFTSIALFFEVYVRIFVDTGMNYGIEMWKYATQVKTISKVSSIGHEHQAGSSARLMGVDVSINSKKLRDVEIPYVRNKGTLRVLMLGDSLTFGWGVEFNKTTSKLLEKQLNENGFKSEVINTGVGNYNTSMEVAYFLNEGKKYNPDIIVLNYFINDAEPTPKYDTDWLSRNSYAYVYGASRMDILLRQLGLRPGWEKYYSNLYKKTSLGRIETEKSIKTLADYSKKNDIKLIVVNYPELRNLKKYPFKIVQDFTNEIAKTVGATYVDLLDIVKGTDESKLWVTREDPHPNGYANTIFAEPIYLAVKKIISNPEFLPQN